MFVSLPLPILGNRLRSIESTKAKRAFGRFARLQRFVHQQGASGAPSVPQILRLIIGSFHSGEVFEC